MLFRTKRQLPPMCAGCIRTLDEHLHGHVMSACCGEAYTCISTGGSLHPLYLQQNSLRGQANVRTMTKSHDSCYNNACGQGEQNICTYGADDSSMRGMPLGAARKNLCFQDLYGCVGSTLLVLLSYQCTWFDIFSVRQSAGIQCMCIDDGIDHIYPRVGQLVTNIPAQYQL